MRPYLSFVLMLVLCTCTPVPASLPGQLPPTSLPISTANPPTMPASVGSQKIPEQVAVTAVNPPSITTVPPALSSMAGLCRPSDVQVEYAGSEVHDTVVALGIVLTNTAAVPCLVLFWPHVRLADAAGKPLDIVYDLPQEASSHTFLLVEPGQAVGFAFGWQNWCLPPAAGGVTIQLSLTETTTVPIDVATAGAGPQKKTVSAGGRCMQPAQKSEVGVGPFGYAVSALLSP
jgi:hypothetical protein